jgi:RNA polymerase sigma-70 factor (ECF subfamily)
MRPVVRSTAATGSAATIEINGELGVVASIAGTVAGVLVPEFADGRITGLRIVANPDKLRFVAAQYAGLSHSRGLSGS